jgi:hypothetical protein
VEAAHADIVLFVVGGARPKPAAVNWACAPWAGSELSRKLAAPGSPTWRLFCGRSYYTPDAAEAALSLANIDPLGLTAVAVVGTLRALTDAYGLAPFVTVHFHEGGRMSIAPRNYAHGYNPLGCPLTMRAYYTAEAALAAARMLLTVMTSPLLGK